MNRRNQKSNWQDQEEALFGSSSSSKAKHNRSASSQPNNNSSRRGGGFGGGGTANGNGGESDEAMAFRLQQEYLEEKYDSIRRIHARDREYALQLQNNGSLDTADNSLADKKRRQQMEEDEKLAKQMQQEEDEYTSSEDDEDLGQMGLEDSIRSSGPLPNSDSINGNVPMGAQPALFGDSSKRDTLQNEINSQQRNGSMVPRCVVCGKMTIFYLKTLGCVFHPDCFRCIACHEVIDPSEPFAFSVGENGEKFPLHRDCYAELFGIKCVVCKGPIPTDASGKMSFVRHPFFHDEKMCIHHTREENRRRCTGCHRFEPIDNKFNELGDGRCVCMSCCRTVIVDNEDGQPQFHKVLKFLKDGLQLPLFQGMYDIPVLIVGHDALNDAQKGNSAHSGSSQIMTRGICLSEYTTTSPRRLSLSNMRYDPRRNQFTQRGNDQYFDFPTRATSSVTAILCLSGLPADLTASILAHEACHAWIKLHPEYDPTIPLPLQVEEGCCQLIAMLFLCDGLEPPNTEPGEDGGPSDEKLRQYFKFSIEADKSEVYGTGYRLAAKAYAKIGIDALLNHVVRHRAFPEI